MVELEDERPAVNLIEQSDPLPSASIGPAFSEAHEQLRVGIVWLKSAALGCHHSSADRDGRVGHELAWRRPTFRTDDRRVITGHDERPYRAAQIFESGAGRLDRLDAVENWRGVADGDAQWNAERP